MGDLIDGDSHVNATERVALGFCLVSVEGYTLYQGIGRLACDLHTEAEEQSCCVSASFCCVTKRSSVSCQTTSISSSPFPGLSPMPAVSCRPTRGSDPRDGLVVLRGVFGPLVCHHPAN